MIDCSEVTLLYRQRFEAGYHIEEFFVDVALPQLVEFAVETFQQFVDLLLGSLHRRQAARVFAGERFRAGSKQADEKILADQCSQRH